MPTQYKYIVGMVGAFYTRTDAGASKIISR